MLFRSRVGGGGCEEARLVVSALAAKPKTIGGLEVLMRGKPLDDELIEAVADLAYRQCRPPTSVPHDEGQRHEMVPVFVRRAMRDAIAGGPPA